MNPEPTTPLSSPGFALLHSFRRDFPLLLSSFVALAGVCRQFRIRHPLLSRFAPFATLPGEHMQCHSILYSTRISKKTGLHLAGRKIAG